MTRFDNVLGTIGNTPIVALRRISKEINGTIYAKLEYFNPGSSIKDRPALNMILKAEEEGKLNSESHVVEPTSGNTGIGIALVSAVKGYKTSLVMPEGASIERRKILKALGANIILVSNDGGMKKAISTAQEMAQNDPNVFIPMQFENAANPEAHKKTTALEILSDMDNKIDAFVAAVGTGGTLTGNADVLKKSVPYVKIVAVEPEKSRVLSGGKAHSHKIQGMGAGFIPEVLDIDLIDDIVAVTEAESYDMTRRLAREEGIFAGISSGAATAAAVKIGKRYPEFENIVVIIPDTGERYLSTDLWEFD